MVGNMQEVAKFSVNPFQHNKINIKAVLETVLNWYQKAIYTLILQNTADSGLGDCNCDCARIYSMLTCYRYQVDIFKIPKMSFVYMGLRKIIGFEQISEA